MRRSWPRCAPISPPRRSQRSEGKTGRVADNWRYGFEIGARGRNAPAIPARWRRSAASASPRCAASANGSKPCATSSGSAPDAYLILQEELDFAEVALTSESERQIEES